MTANELRAAQAPLKARYRAEPNAAVVNLSASGTVDAEAQAFHVQTHLGLVEAGHHVATGGDGTKACSADMLLQSLISCAGITLGTVATAMGIAVRSGRIWAEGEIDFRGTLGVAKDIPIGFRNLRLHFDVHTDAEPEAYKRLIELTERYCVVYQTLKQPPPVEVLSG
jgi:uncharacterized OsmC-like protein